MLAHAVTYITCKVKESPYSDKLNPSCVNHTMYGVDHYKCLLTLSGLIEANPQCVNLPILCTNSWKPAKCTFCMTSTKWMISRTHTAAMYPSCESCYLDRINTITYIQDRIWKATKFERSEWWILVYIGLKDYDFEPPLRRILVLRALNVIAGRFLVLVGTAEVPKDVKRCIVNHFPPNFFYLFASDLLCEK